MALAPCNWYYDNNNNNNNSKCSHVIVTPSQFEYPYVDDSEIEPKHTLYYLFEHKSYNNNNAVYDRYTIKDNRQLWAIDILTRISTGTRRNSLARNLKIVWRKEKEKKNQISILDTNEGIWGFDLVFSCNPWLVVRWCSFFACRVFFCVFIFCNVQNR